MDGDKLTETVNGIDKSAEYVDDIVDAIVQSCCSELDQYVTYVKGLLDDVNTPIQDVELDDIILTIPTLLYFAGNSQESLGIREDVAKLDETNRYNTYFMASSGSTAALRQAYAKLQVQNESLATLVYQRACKKVKLRCDYALEILQSTKKILSRRMTEMELSRSSPNKNQSQ